MGTDLIRPFLALLGLAGLLASPDAFAESGLDPVMPPPFHIYDCRYSPRDDPTDGAAGFGHIGFPRDDVFRPLLAAPMEPRFSGTFGGAAFDPDLGGGDDLSRVLTAFVGLAGSAGLWSWRDPGECDGLQVSMFGGAFSQFAMNPLFLLNVDYHGGLSATAKWGRLSGRLRVYHQSSHLGDDFLLANPDITTYNLSFEAVDLVGALVGPWWRIYAGGGWFLRVDPAEFGRANLRLGLELRSDVWERPAPISTMLLAPVAGTDLLSHQARDWGVTWNTMVGAELVSQKSLRRFRLLATFLHGYVPYGYFFQAHQVTSPGLKVHFVY